MQKKGLKISRYWRLIANAKTKARQKERARVEPLYIAEQERQRKEFLKKTQEQKIAFEKEKEDEIKRIENNFALIAKDLKQEITDLKERVESARKAYKLFKDFIPKAYDYSQKLQTITYGEQQRIMDRHKISQQIADGLDFIHTELTKKAPQIEALLRID